MTGRYLQVSDMIIEDVVKLYAVCSMSNECVAVSVQTEQGHAEVRLYDIFSHTVTGTIERDESGNHFFSKPLYLASTGKNTHFTRRERWRERGKG